MESMEDYTTSSKVRKDFLCMVIGILVIGIFIGAVLASIVWVSTANGEDSSRADRKGTEERWALCQPDSYLNIREEPKKGANICGWLYLGDRVETDGKVKNGYLHIIRASTETGDGWVAARYLMEIPPKVQTVTGTIESKSRVAARSQPGGKRNRWMKPGDKVTVYAFGSEWTVTDRGFIRSEFVAIGE